MNEVTKHKLIWGWLRLVLGWVQISCALIAVVLLIAIGFQLLTWLFFGGAIVAIITSRLLYHGQSGPLLNKDNGQD